MIREAEHIRGKETKERPGVEDKVKEKIMGLHEKHKRRVRVSYL